MLLKMPKKHTLPLASDTAAITPKGPERGIPKWGIDWLSITVWGMTPDEVALVTSEAFHVGRAVGLSGWSEKGGAAFYRQRYEYLGASLLFGLENTWRCLLSYRHRWSAYLAREVGAKSKEV
jgi:hypothetical protein